MASSSSHHGLFSLLFYFLLFTNFCHAHQLLRRPNAALFIFGDSILDPGNNNYIETTSDFRANFGPYGQTFFGRPTGRFSDGRLIPDFIAEYAKLPLISPYMQFGGAADDNSFIHGANFASGGAGALVETYQGFVIDLKEQLKQFKEVMKLWNKRLGYSEAKERMSKAVFLFSIGSNDCIYPFDTDPSVLHSYSHTEYVAMVIGNFTSVIKDIYEEGGRTFGYITIMPLGCTPYVKALKPAEINGQCWEEVNTLAELLNAAVSESLRELSSRLKGFEYSCYDFHTFIYERIRRPSEFGLKEGEAGCYGQGPYRGGKSYELCSDASEFVFFDCIHPSERIYQQFAELMWRGHPNMTGAYKLETLFDQCQGYV